LSKTHSFTTTNVISVDFFILVTKMFQFTNTALFDYEVKYI